MITALHILGPAWTLTTLLVAALLVRGAISDVCDQRRARRFDQHADQAIRVVETDIDTEYERLCQGGAM